jgi:hypothetical protein
MSHNAGGTAPVKYVVPRVSGDAGAAYRIAVAFQGLADQVSAVHRHVAAIAAGLAPVWRGQASVAIDEPLRAFLRNSTLLVGVLEEAAAAYHSYGQQLERAHQQHHLSLTKVLKVGAIAAVSATAIVVTVGAAGAVEAAAAGAAVAGASEATESALFADSIVAATLESAFDAVPAIRPLLTFVLPKLVQAEWAAGSLAVWDEATTGRLRWGGIGETAGLAFTATAVAAKGVELVSGSRWLPHVVESASWSGAAAADDELLDHRLDLADVAETFVLAGGGTWAREALKAKGWWRAEPDYRRAALLRLAHRDGLITDRGIAHEMALLRQPVSDLLRGEIDLRLNEGPGHTVARHVARTPAQLLARLRTSSIPVASTYWDAAGARDAIQQTLTSHTAVIQRWVAGGCVKPLRLHLHSPYDVGFAIDRSGKVTFVRHAIVVLRRDQAGVILVTSFPTR